VLSIQKMKVLHLGKLCPPNEGGIELFTFDLLENLNKKGVKADLLCFGEDTKIDMYKGFRYFSYSHSESTSRIFRSNITKTHYCSLALRYCETKNKL
jgi:hypothetical protein